MSSKEILRIHIHILIVNIGKEKTIEYGMINYPQLICGYLWMTNIR
jgi:hypothetical protein